MVRKRPKWCTWPKKCIQSSYSTKLGHLERRARIQLGRMNFGVFSMTCFVPLALTSDWTWPALSSVIRHLSSLNRHLSSVTEKLRKWSFFVTHRFHHWWGDQTEWKWPFFVTQRFRHHWQGVPGGRLDVSIILVFAIVEEGGSAAQWVNGVFASVLYLLCISNRICKGWREWERCSVGRVSLLLGLDGWGWSSQVNTSLCSSSE